MILKNFVITSYSIHYTKLYDLSNEDFVIKSGERICQMVINKYEHTQLVEVVITSYSIHYTKLYEPYWLAICHDSLLTGAHRNNIESGVECVNNLIPNSCAFKQLLFNNKIIQVNNPAILFFVDKTKYL